MRLNNLAFFRHQALGLPSCTNAVLVGKRTSYTQHNNCWSLCSCLSLFNVVHTSRFTVCSYFVSIVASCIKEPYDSAAIMTSILIMIMRVMLRMFTGIQLKRTLAMLNARWLAAVLRIHRLSCDNASDACCNKCPEAAPVRANAQQIAARA